MSIPLPSWSRAGPAGSGLSNREAAAELYVSAKAIEYHLGNIYAKTGITSRHQLGAVLSPQPAAGRSAAAVLPGQRSREVRTPA